MSESSRVKGVIHAVRKQPTVGSTIHYHGAGPKPREGFDIEPIMDKLVNCDNNEFIQYYRTQKHEPKNRCECRECQSLVWKRGILNLKFCTNCNHHHFNREPCPRCGQNGPDTMDISRNYRIGDA